MDPSQQLRALQHQIQKLQNQMAQILGVKAQLSCVLQQANLNNAELLQRLNIQGSSCGLGRAVVRIRKPKPFRRNGSIQSRVLQMENYVSHAPDEQKLAIAVSFLEGNAHK